jgi:large conductance mechanosensitive channel
MHSGRVRIGKTVCMGSGFRRNDSISSPAELAYACPERSGSERRGDMAGFREFLARGNVLDLAVAVIIGGAFGTIVTSLTDDVIMPLVGAIFGGLDFSAFFIRLGPIPADYAGDPNNYAALKEAGVPMLGYGQFVTALVNFLILAFIIYQLVRMASRLRAREDSAPPAPPVPSDELLVLREIRDELKQRA